MSIEINVSSALNAPAAQAFNAWIEPDYITGWMFGPKVRDEQIVAIQTEARVGGRFSFKVLRNGEEINHVGTYREVLRHHKLVFSWGVEGESDGDQSEVTITITETSSGCVVALNHRMDPKWADYAERVKKGWEFMLSKQKELLEQ